MLPSGQLSSVQTAVFVIITWGHHTTETQALHLHSPALCVKHCDASRCIMCSHTWHTCIGLDWFAYSAVVRNNSVVVRNDSAKFVVLISLNEATWITSRVLHLACGQETSATRNFFEIDFAREFSFVENYSKPLRFVCLLSLCCFVSASLAEKVVEQTACCYFYFTQEETDIRSCKIGIYYEVMIIELKVLALLPKWHGVLRT